MSVQGLARRKAAVVGAVLPCQEEKPFAHSAEVAGRKVRNGEKARPFVGAQTNTPVKRCIWISNSFVWTRSQP